EGDAADLPADGSGHSALQRNGHESTLQVVDLHEMRVINQVLEELAGYGIRIRDLLSAGSKDGLPIQPFTLNSGDEAIRLSSLRATLVEIRKLGEQGLKLTRLKGLGKMNADELGTTAMAPRSRTLLKVTMQDAAAADEIFRVLMGDPVEPRRDFIEKHAL